MVAGTGSPKKEKVPQPFLAKLQAFSLVFAVEIGILAIVLAIKTLIGGGSINGFLSYFPFWFSISAVAFGLILLFSAKKVTDHDQIKCAYGKAAAFLFIEFVIAATAAVAVLPFALFAVGVGEIQGTLWLDFFLPALGTAAVAAGLLVAVKKIKGGYAKLLPILTYVIFGIAGIALILSIVSTFVGFYGGGGGRYYYY
jgi:hypothetical protein